MNIYICEVEEITKAQSNNIPKEILLSVIIVTYRSWGCLNTCLDHLTLIDSDAFRLDVVVVDNDVFSDALATCKTRFTKVKFVSNTGNNGFSNGCNLGANHAKGNYFLFINPDTIVNKEALIAMLQHAIDNPNSGIVSCREKNDSGKQAKEMRFFPELKTLFGVFRSLYRCLNRKSLHSKFEVDKKIVHPDWVSGSVMLMSRRWFQKLKGWNENYWMYYEDIDLCHRVTINGGVISLLRDVHILHNHGGSSRKNSKISAITKAQVLISKHVYIDDFFSGKRSFFIQMLLVLYVLSVKLFNACIGLLFFFIPAMYVRFMIFIKMLSYYRSCLKHKTWLSERSVNHVLNKNNEKKAMNKLIIGYDAKRVFHNKTGLGNYSRDLVSILSKHYSDCDYLLYNPKQKRVDRLALRDNLIEVLPKSAFWSQYSSIWRQGPIVKQLKEDKIDVFHGLTGEIPRGLLEANIKSVVTIHDLIFVRYPQFYKSVDRMIHLTKFLFAAKNATKIIAISEQTKRDVVEFLKVSPEKVVVVYQGCHKIFKEIQTDVFKEEVRKKYHLPKDFILNVGTIEERKNLLLCVKAIKDIDVILVVVGGKTKYYDVVCSFIKENKMSHKVLFLEDVALTELAALYQMSNLFLYPSLFEGFGIPIIEALYSKTPVITSKGSCFSEAGGPGSIYVSPVDETELKQKIKEVLSNPILKEQMVEDGYRFVQKFNDKVIAKNVMNLYIDLLQ